ncbi:MAG: glycogen debranching protein GlgX [Glaciecola sp.]
MSHQNCIEGLNDYSLLPGSVSPYGASLTSKGCNFSIYAPDAKAVYVCLFDKNEQLLAQIELAQRKQSNWFGCIANVDENYLYGIRVQPKQNRPVNSHSNINKLLIDPYAKAINRAVNFSEALYQNDSSKMVPKAHIVASAPQHLTPLSIAPQQRIIYETHVKGLTQCHPQVPEKLRGTYLGACDPVVISHLQDLGVTSVQFLPLMSFMPESFTTKQGLTNYWGYNPINFFAPEPRYAVSNALQECKKMVQCYRDAGIEVILDVVFNHTCEGGEDGPVLSFKGLCESHAYLQEQVDESDSNQHLNYSGCGNTIRVSDTYMSTLLLDALRYWVSEIGVSGFRFDLASVVGREVFEFKKTATFFKILRQDPILKHALMLAEPWDIGPGGYQLGHYPNDWLEVNDKYRDVVRAFWRGDKGLKGEFATRLMGSRDIFRKNIRPMHASVNNITYHDGYTLHDIVTYADKHNFDNLEDNRDGHNHNLSANYGVEGETNNPQINALRAQQKRNLFATLLLSQGTPHILGGDELSRTQNGNNNAYCQDNELNWYNWQLSSSAQSFLDFCQYVIQLRQQHSLLQQMTFADDLYDNSQNIQSADWYRRDGSHKTDIDWVNHEHHCFALHIIGYGTNASDAVCEANLHQQQWLFCVNSLDKAREFNLPILQNTSAWKCVLDTALVDINQYSKRSVSGVFEMSAHSMLVFTKQ